jgi:hypothetical protein
VQNVAPILQGLASLGWVAFAFVFLLVFRPDISRLLRRLRKGKLLGQEVELDEELEKLEISGVAAVKEAEALPLEERRLPTGEAETTLDATIRSILQQAARDPKVALMTLWAELEKQGRQALATRGLLRNRQLPSISEALSELHQYGFPQNMSGSLQLFADARNKIVHGRTATDDDALSALDSGITILRAINVLPNEINVVYHPGVEIFSDANCTAPIADAKGVILETTSPGGALKTHRIFPTTRAHFQKGKRVTWEWNMQKVWPQAWCRDPDSNEIKEAWRLSAEFIGRHLDEV